MFQSRTFRRPRYADVAATLALILALGGTAYAATALPRNSVGTPQLKAQAVTGPKIAPHTIGAAKLAPGAVDVTSLGGIDETGLVSFSLSGNACGQLNLGVTGARVGEVAAMSFTGNVAVPANVVTGPMKVRSSTQIVTRLCNVGADPVSVQSIGVRVVTFP